MNPVQEMFYWWGRLCAHGISKGSFPARASNLLAFVAPKIRKMGFTLEEQTTTLSSFLKGVYKIFIKEAKQDLDE